MGPYPKRDPGTRTLIISQSWILTIKAENLFRLNVIRTMLSACLTFRNEAYGRSKRTCSSIRTSGAAQSDWCRTLRRNRHQPAARIDSARSETNHQRRRRDAVSRHGRPQAQIRNHAERHAQNVDGRDDGCTHTVSTHWSV